MMQRIRAVGLGAVVVTSMAAPGVMYFEGYIPKTYKDPVGINTACWGETGAHIQPGMTFTRQECEQLLDASLETHWQGMTRCLIGEITPGEASAILSWSYNIGTGAACTSTLARMVNAGTPGEIWCHQLTRWTKATKAGVKIELPGLVKRRQAELSMCLTGQWPEWVNA